MVSFGDIEIPWITSEDVGVAKDVVEKNFVEKSAKIFELTPDLKSGSYSVILNEDVQTKNENFVEQQDAVLSMATRHGSEFPYVSSGDSGYALVHSSNVNTYPSLEIREGELQLRVLKQVDFRSAVSVFPRPSLYGDFEKSASPVESYVAFPSSINIIDKTANYTVSTEDGDISLYTFTDDDLFEFEEDSSDVTLSQTQSICKLFNSVGERVYSKQRVVDEGSSLSNSLVSITSSVSGSSFEYYDGTSWVSIGSTQLPFNDAFVVENSNDEITFESSNGNRGSIYRGFSTVEYTFSSQSSFDFTPSETFTEQAANDYYYHWQDASGRDIIIVRDSNDGSFYTGASDIGIQNLNPDLVYSVFVGVVPSAVAVDDYARYVYNFGRRNRTFTQTSSASGLFGRTFGRHFGGS